MHSRAILLACVTLLCLMMVAMAQSGEASYLRTDYPDPQRAPNLCGRGQKKSYLCDPNLILNPGEADQLDREIEKVMNDTMCPCSQQSCSSRKYSSGYRIGVALMNKMADDMNIPKNEDDDKMEQNLDKARLFAYTLLLNWKIGECQEDIIIVYSKEDNVLYTMTGDVAQKKLKNELVGQISMEGRGYFGANTFEGLLYLITKFREVLSDKYVVNPVKSPQTAALTDSSPFSLASATFVILCSLLAAIFSL